MCDTSTYPPVCNSACQTQSQGRAGFVMGYFMYWFNIVRKQKKIRLEIGEYVVWRFSRFPTTTASHREWLYKFALHCGKREVRDISDIDVKDFLNGLNGEYAKGESAKAIYSFLSFHGLGTGFQDHSVNAIIPIMKKRGRPADLVHIKLVKKLKNVDRLSFPRIQKELLEKEGRKFYISQLHDWYHYDLQAKKGYQSSLKNGEL